MEEGLVPKETVPGSVVVTTVQVDVSFTAPEIWLLMLGFPTACT
jgi:hypothetical protein